MGLFLVSTGSGESLVLDDPSGGTFAAAGDFDRWMGRAGDDSGVLGRLDPYADRTFSNDELVVLRSEANELLESIRLRIATDPDAATERALRGLLRLVELVDHCQAHPEDGLVWQGD